VLSRSPSVPSKAARPHYAPQDALCIGPAAGMAQAPITRSAASIKKKQTDGSKELANTAGPLRSTLRSAVLAALPALPHGYATDDRDAYASLIRPVRLPVSDATHTVPPRRCRPAEELPAGASALSG
jgi:hypothetical protein